MSRVGGAAQVKAMRKVAGPLRLNLAQFRELEAFAEFGSELDATSLAQLDRGRRVVETLKQGQYEPVPVSEQVLVIYAVTEGFVDDIEPSDVAAFEVGLREFARERHGSLLAEISDTGTAPDDDIVAAINAYKATLGDGEPTGELEA